MNYKSFDSWIHFSIFSYKSKNLIVDINGHLISIWFLIVNAEK